MKYNEFKVVVKQVSGCYDNTMILETYDGYFVVGTEFDKVGIRPYACSREYRTIKGAETFAQKKYKAA